jgi:hypothetical protein
MMIEKVVEVVQGHWVGEEERLREEEVLPALGLKEVKDD